MNRRSKKCESAEENEKEQRIFEHIGKKKNVNNKSKFENLGKLTLLLKGMIKGKNWKDKQKLKYEEQIMNDI